jgi:nucleotide-binding universal stress UspA family protein
MEISADVRMTSDSADPPDPGALAVGVGASPSARAALSYAFAAAARRDAPLIAIHVWAAPPWSPADASLPVAYAYDNAHRQAVRFLTTVLAGYAARYPDVRVRPEIACETDVAEALVRLSRHTGLMVVGAGAPGSQVGETLLRHGQCPVAIIADPVTA